MPELIDRGAVLKLAYHNYYPSIDHLCCSVKCATYDELEALPTIEPEVRHGRWLPCLMLKFRYECGCCGEPSNYPTPYCPNCGADMREEGADNAE